MTANDLRRWQNHMDYTQAQAAAALGTPLATYRRWLSGRNPNTGKPISIGRPVDLACAALAERLAPFSEYETH